jgi:uncharacterized protein (DUF362 family)
MDSNLHFSNPTTAAYRLPVSAYPAPPPFHPNKLYPEYQWEITAGTNWVYQGVRELFHLLKLDDAYYDTPFWNPLGEIVRPGDKVILKPNFLYQSHKFRHEEWEQVITHGSVVRAVLDYILIALKSQGEVWITDGPQFDADWTAIIERTGVREMVKFFEKVSPVPVHLLDLRDTWIEVRDEVAFSRMSLPGDPAGGTVVNLGHLSRFVGHHGSGRYHGSDYSEEETNDHHGGGRHEYRISRTVASADVFINLPKMKTHKKVGVTLCLKNLVGINAGRNWLPHHTGGDPSTGGDQFPAPSLKYKTERLGIRKLQNLTLRYPRLFAPIFRLAKKVATPIYGHTQETIRSGNWHGNDTAWRMVHDINRCFLYSDGVEFPLIRPKRFFAVVDGVIAGDGNGPEAPDRKEAGVLLAGFNPVAVDCSTAILMGFDPMKIPMLKETFSQHELPLAPFDFGELRIVSNHLEWTNQLSAIDPKCCYHFKPHFGWTGTIERVDTKPMPEPV